ncbi:helix-hairpin-helix domain-containing protein [Thiomicrospira microaerophila]|uniref:helix-hairpin-helix domain-containing protein n=1 Tax=Thiomicrospira microaerophila TaxID=406020 RepID=UPI0005CAD408|nr:helix-hairpin-helix domain-containing protein [Thiomicrospira microaerophila]
MRKKLMTFIFSMLLSFSAWSVQINVNTADARLMANNLSGIGMGKAEDIIRHREEHGEFKTLKDLARVKGIGPRTLERNADKIKFSDE